MIYFTLIQIAQLEREKQEISAAFDEVGKRVNSVYPLYVIPHTKCILGGDVHFLFTICIGLYCVFLLKGNFSFRFFNVFFYILYEVHSTIVCF